MASARRRPAGFTLVEAMIAMAILAVGAAGAMAGMVASWRNLREGQMRQSMMTLIDASAQRLLLSDKRDWASKAQQGVVVQPHGIDGWQPDNSRILVPGDLAGGNLYKVEANGEVHPVNEPGLDQGTPCSDSRVPPDSYCREVALVTGVPAGIDPALLANATNPMTYWIRVYRKRDGVKSAVVHREVVIP